MFLDKLESGFLLFETEQGWVRVDLSFGQRVYLLWTFRNFRQLSIPLLNPRQRTLVNSLFRNHAAEVLHSFELLPVIGVVEKFVPPTLPDEFSLVQKTAREKPWREQAEVVEPRAEIATPVLVPSLSPKAAWFKLAKFKLAKFKPIPSEPIPPKPAASKPAAAGLATSRLATAIGALALCIVSVAAWHRIQGIPGSEAHNQPRLQQIAAITDRDSTNSAKPTAAIAESPTAIAPQAITVQPLVVPNLVNPNLAVPQPAAPPEAAPEASVKTASIVAVVPAREPNAIRMPRRAIRVRDRASTASLPRSIQDNAIQATRPPLHFVYPASPDNGAHGKVSLTAGLDSNGVVRTVRVVAGNRALAAAAVHAVRQWRYHPYLKDGKPVATSTNIVISFISDDAISMSYPPTIPAIR